MVAGYFAKATCAATRVTGGRAPTASMEAQAAGTP
jgi:hypothetical protein